MGENRTAVERREYFIAFLNVENFNYCITVVYIGFLWHYKHHLGLCHYYSVTFVYKFTKTMALVNIPRLDLLQYTEGTAEQRHQFAQDIGKAFNETGFVTIANHGLSQDLIDELYAVVKAFF